MRLTWAPVGCGLLLPAIMAAGMSGCSSAEHKSADESISVRNHAVATIEDLRNELRRADLQLNKTQGSLANLTTYYGDPMPVYRDFTSDIEKTRDISRGIADDTTRMAQSATVFTTDWNSRANQIQQTALRDETLQQQGRASGQQAEMLTAMSDFQVIYADYIRKLEDTRAFAAANLSESGLRELSNHLQPVRDAATRVHQKIISINGDLSTVASDWRLNNPPALGVEADVRPAGATLPPTTQPVK